MVQKISEAPNNLPHITDRSHHLHWLGSYFHLSWGELTSEGSVIELSMGQFPIRRVRSIMFEIRGMWVWVNTYRYIFSGLFTSINPSYDLGFTRGTRVLTHPHVISIMFSKILPCDSHATDGNINFQSNASEVVTVTPTIRLSVLLRSSWFGGSPDCGWLNCHEPSPIPICFGTKSPELDLYPHLRSLHSCRQVLLRLLRKEARLHARAPSKISHPEISHDNKS